jgi:hypothetical protein
MNLMTNLSAGDRLYVPSRDAACDEGVRETLEGVVRLKEMYGPPGWGETPKQDSRWTMAILKLTPESRKVVVGAMASCLDEGATTREVQIWLEKSNEPWSKYKNKKVHLEGTLSSASGAPAEILPMQLSVSRALIQ